MFKFRTGEEIGSEQLLGIKEDDLKKQLNAGVEANTKLTGVETSVNEIKTQFESLKESLAKLAGNKGNNGGTNNDPPPNTELDLSDPAKAALAVSINANKNAMTAIVNGVRSQMRDTTDDNGKFKFPFWDYLSKDIEELTKNDDLSAKQNPAYWENAYAICAFKKQAEIADKKITGRRVFVEGVTGGGASDNKGTINNNNEPSDIDKQQAIKFGIPIEKYMASKAQMRVW